MLEKLYDSLKELPGIIGVNDKNSTMVTGSRGLANLLGVDHADKLVGIDDSRLPCPASGLADRFVLQDKVVLQNHRVKVMDVNFYGKNSEKKYYW